MNEIFANVLEFMLTFVKMQNTNPSMCTKFEIRWQSILEVIQVFHTVRIVLYNGCSGPVVECLNKINMKQSTTRPLGQNTRYSEQNYAYSMKSLNNFQNAPASDFNFFYIKVLLSCILAEVSINSRT